MGLRLGYPWHPMMGKDAHAMTEHTTIGIFQKTTQLYYVILDIDNIFQCI
jgi:hypothetical protein